MIRSRRAESVRATSRCTPGCSGLRYLTPSGFLCFVFLEGAVALGILLALAELVSWWGVLVLPATVAVMVKLNDVVAGSADASGRAARRPATAEASAPRRRRRWPRVPEEFAMDDLSLSRARTVDLRNRGGPAASPTMPGRGRERAERAADSRAWTEQLDLREQRARQSAARRYE